MSDLKYWVGFNRILGIGRARFSQLEGYFGDLERAWQASAAELKAAGLDSKSIEAIVVSRPDISPDTELERLERNGIKALTWNDPAFPARPGSAGNALKRCGGQLTFWLARAGQPGLASGRWEISLLRGWQRFSRLAGGPSRCLIFPTFRGWFLIEQPFRKAEGCQAALDS